MVDQIEKSLERASEQELAALYLGVGTYLNDNADKLDDETMDGGVTMLAMIEAEATGRSNEPVWRKAKRLAVRNAGQIGKTAAAVAVGAFLGIELSD